MQRLCGTSLSDITGVTKLIKGSAYGNFENKDEVALAVFDYNWSRVSATLSTEIAIRSSARQKLLAYADIYSNYEKHPFPCGGCPLLNTAVESDATHAALRGKAIIALNNWKKTIVRIIEQGKKDRDFKAYREITALTLKHSTCSG